MDLAFYSVMLLAIMSEAMGKHHKKQRHKSTGNGSYVRGCYYTTWSKGRAVPFFPEHITKELCSHVMIAFGNLDTSGNVGIYEDTDYDLYKRVAALKSTDPNLKILISYGGGNFGSWAFTQIAQSSTARSQFIQSSLKLIKEYNFDGLDLDWEYPTGVSSYHALLSKEFRQAFDEDGTGLLLTGAVTANAGTAQQSYDVKLMASIYDYIFLMSYDLHGSWESTTDMHAKLREISGNGIYNTEYAAQAWVDLGMPKNKIVIGIPTYGKGYTLSSSSSHGVGASAKGSANPTAVYTDGTGAAYWEICDMISSGGTEVTEKNAVGAYMYKGDQWYGYDNPETIKLKMTWLKQKGYAGAFIWALDTDDFTGKKCGKGAYPLMNAINQGLGIVPVPDPTSTTTESTHTTSGQHTITSSHTTAHTRTTATRPNPTTTTHSTSEVTCPKANGYFRHPVDCTKFVQCNGGIPYLFDCPAGLFFNESVEVCDHMRNAPSGRC